jgi:hypothetical protein
MAIDIRLVDSKALLKKYIYLGRGIYKNEPRWVPPFYLDEWDFHHPFKNEALSYCKTIRVLAFKNHKAVGRIMGIIHEPYNQAHQEKTARFFHFDCINDPEVSHALIAFIENWAAQNGMNKVIGPFGFSDKDPQGLQVEGFEHLPVLATPANPAYLPALLEQEGYTKEVDCVSYRIEIPKEVPEKYLRVIERIRQQNSLSLVEFTSRRSLKPYILPVLHLVNDTYSSLFGFAPMSEAEMKKFAWQYLPVLDPEFVKVIIDKNQEVKAFVVAMPDISAGIQRARGKLFPVGFLYVLRAMRQARQLNLMLGAVDKRYQGSGLSALLGKALFKSAHRRNMNVMDSHLILETNYPMRGECEKLNGKVYKRFRIFSKRLV